MGVVKENKTRRGHLWQQIVGAILLVLTALFFLIRGIKGHFWELYKLAGGGVYVYPWQQIAIGILILGLTVWLFITEIIKNKNRKK
jgi:uncharacterized membrane protein